ncbi:MAG: hypothetical protein ACW98Y_14010, partial [Candidatus Thorarchaeota archaeon]
MKSESATDNIYSESKNSLSLVSVFFFLTVGVTLPFLKMHDFLILSSHQNLAITIINFGHWIVLILGVSIAGLLLIQSKNLLLRGVDGLSPTTHYSSILMAFAFIVVLANGALLLFGELSAFELFQVGGVQYWQFWPRISTLQLGVFMFSSLGLLILTHKVGSGVGLDFIFSPFKKLGGRLRSIARILCVILYSMLGYLLPILGVTGYYQGHYLIGKATVRYTATEIFYLDRMGLLYGLPRATYSTLGEPLGWLDVMLQSGPLLLTIGFLISLGSITACIILKIYKEGSDKQIRILSRFGFLCWAITISITWTLPLL